MTLSNVVSALANPATTLQFAITNFYAPPTNQPADPITVTTYSSASGGAIDTCQAYVTGLQP